MPVYLKAALVLIAVTSAFNLGRYSVAFSGRTAAWISLVCGIVALAAAVLTLIFG
jgi:hypothetical protein